VVECVALEPLEPKGKAEPVAAWRALGLLEEHAGGARAARRCGRGRLFAAGATNGKARGSTTSAMPAAGKACGGSLTVAAGRGPRAAGDSDRTSAGNETGRTRGGPSRLDVARVRAQRSAQKCTQPTMQT
jgi:hypothetical protein